MLLAHVSDLDIVNKTECSAGVRLVAMEGMMDLITTVPVKGIGFEPPKAGLPP